MGDRELHPPSWRYRLVRRTRRYRDTRGWGRLADFVAARGMSGRFRVANGSFIHEGDVSDLIDRELYLRGGYEDQKISLFLSRVPSDRRTSILDVGANVGTHTLPFARTFAQVHAFEPNPEVVRKLRQNVALNDNLNVAIHPCGLSDERAERTFYSVPSKHNPGLGTFSSVEQYDVPLDAVDRLEVVEGDGYLESLGVERVDAIKVDVQGYEHRVLAGLRRTLEHNRPYVWIEYGAATRDALKDGNTFRAMFPYPIDLFLFAYVTHGCVHATQLVDVQRRTTLPFGDYLVVPRP